MNKATLKLMIAVSLVTLISVFLLSRSDKLAEVRPDLDSAPPSVAQSRTAPQKPSLSVNAARLRQSNIINRAREDSSKSTQPEMVAMPGNPKYMPELVELNTQIITNGTVSYRTTIKQGGFTFSSLTKQPTAQARAEQVMADIAAATETSDPDGLARTRYEDYEQKVEKLKKGMSLEAVLGILGEPETKALTKYGHNWVYSPYPGRTKAMMMDIFPMLYLEANTNGTLVNFYFRQDPMPFSALAFPLNSP